MPRGLENEMSAEGEKTLTDAFVPYCGILSDYASVLGQVKEFAAAIAGGRSPPPPVTAYWFAEAKIRAIAESATDTGNTGEAFIVATCTYLCDLAAIVAASDIVSRYNDFVGRLAACAEQARKCDAICLLESVADAADSLAQAAAAAARLAKLTELAELAELAEIAEAAL